MSLSNRRRLFFRMRAKCQVIVKNHAFMDYPKRGFSKLEMVDLVRFGVGQVRENTSLEAIPESFLFLVKADSERICKLVVLMEKIEIEDEFGVGGTKIEAVIVCSAYREVNDETKKN